MKITLKDGSFKEYEGSMSVLDITKDISEGLARVATSARVNGEVVDLRHVVDEDCELEILTFDNEEGKGAFWHTTSHIMAQAIKRVFIRSHYNTRFYFVNIFSATVSRLQNIPAQNNSEIITDGSSPLSETDS